MVTELTPREKQVIELVREGMTTKQIAGRLNLSPRTIEIYRAKGCEKLGIKSVREQLESLNISEV